MRHTIILRSVVVLFVASCQRPASLTESQRTGIKKDVQQTMEGIFADMKANGIASELKYFDHSSQFFWVLAPKPAQYSYEDIKAILEEEDKRFTSVEGKWDSIRVEPLAPGFASYTATVHAAYTDTAGNVTKYGEVQTGVLVQRKDGWKFLHGQSFVLPEQQE